MALHKGRLFAGALFAGALFGAAEEYIYSPAKGVTTQRQAPKPTQLLWTQEEPETLPVIRSVDTVTFASSPVESTQFEAITIEDVQPDYETIQQAELLALKRRQDEELSLLMILIAA